MKKIFATIILLAALMLVTSCQKELPDDIKNIDVSKGGQTQKPTPTPTPENPTVQGDIPVEGDNPWPGY
jgi:predicted small lipoprotein YifL